MTGALKPTNDRKTRGYESQQNTFGLTPGLPADGGTCPGATAGQGGCLEKLAGRKCPTCYVHKLMGARPNVRRSLEHNANLMASLDVDGMTYQLMAEFERFAADNARRGSATTANYRLHWSGDIFSPDYADALVRAMVQFPAINFWGYTRTIDQLPKFAGLPNCVMYVSIDQDNQLKAWNMYQRCRPKGSVGIAWLARERPDLEELTPCPVDIGSMPLDGACHRCRSCLRGRPVWFKTK